MRFKVLAAVVSTGCILAGCANGVTRTLDVSSLPNKDTLELCKIAITNSDEAYRTAAARLVVRRGATLEKCQQLIATDGAIMTGIAVVGVAAAAGAAAPNDYGGYRTYRGNCPTPDSLDAAGHRCGRRSAASRPGGYSGYGGY